MIPWPDFSPSTNWPRYFEPSANVSHPSPWRLSCFQWPTYLWHKRAKRGDYRNKNKCLSNVYMHVEECSNTQLRIGLNKTQDSLEAQALLGSRTKAWAGQRFGAGGAEHSQEHIDAPKSMHTTVHLYASSTGCMNARPCIWCTNARLYKLLFLQGKECANPQGHNCYEAQ